MRRFFLTTHRWLGQKLHFLTFVPSDISTVLRGVFAVGGMAVAATGLYLFFARLKRITRR